VGLAIVADRQETTFLRCASVDYYPFNKDVAASGTTEERDYGDIYFETGFGRGLCGGLGR
jgi:hypothetical protein